MNTSNIQNKSLNESLPICCHIFFHNDWHISERHLHRFIFQVVGIPRSVFPILGQEWFLFSFQAKATLSNKITINQLEHASFPWKASRMRFPKHQRQSNFVELSCCGHFPVVRARLVGVERHPCLAKIGFPKVGWKADFKKNLELYPPWNLKHLKKKRPGPKKESSVPTIQEHLRNRAWNTSQTQKS